MARSSFGSDLAGAVVHLTWVVAYVATWYCIGLGACHSAQQAANVAVLFQREAQYNKNAPISHDALTAICLELKCDSRDTIDAAKISCIGMTLVIFVAFVLVLARRAYAWCARIPGS